MVARIYRPAKPATQSGWAKTRRWVLEMEPRSRKEAAIAYARRQGIEYRVYEPREPVVRPKSYADNFIRRT